VLKLLEDLDKIGIAYLTFSGGEPLLRKDFNIIAKKISGLGFLCTLNTNGTLITENNAELISKSFDIIRVSIDGNEKTHDKIRGKKGCYKKTSEGIDLLYSISGRKSKICVCFSVNRDNVNQMKDFFRAFERKCDSLSFMPIWQQRKSKLHKGMYVYKNKQFIKTWLNLTKTKKLDQPDEMIRPPNLKTGKKYCDAAKLYYHILPNGSVTPCANRKNSPILGNIKEHNILTIINTPLTKEQNRMINKCMGCYSRCTTEISMLMRKSPLELSCVAPKLLRRYKF